MTPAYFFCLLASSVIKTMTAPAVWQSCLRGVYDVFAELLCNLRSCVIGLFVCKHPKPNNPSPLLRSRQPHPSLLLCSNLKESQQFWSCLPISQCDYLFVIQEFLILASVKRIGGSCEAPAYFFCLLASSVIKTMTAPAVWQSNRRYE